MRRQQLDPAHQHVEQPLARRLLGHVGIIAGEHRAVDLLYVGGQNREGRTECAAQVGERNAGALGDLGKADLFDRLFGKQRHEGVDDALALGSSLVGSLARAAWPASICDLRAMTELPDIVCQPSM